MFWAKEAAGAIFFAFCNFVFNIQLQKTFCGLHFILLGASLIPIWQSFLACLTHSILHTRLNFWPAALQTFHPVVEIWCSFNRAQAHSGVLALVHTKDYMCALWSGYLVYSLALVHSKDCMCALAWSAGGAGGGSNLVCGQTQLLLTAPSIQNWQLQLQHQHQLQISIRSAWLSQHQNIQMSVSIISIGVRTISISMISKVTISISTEVCNLLSLMGAVNTLKSPKWQHQKHISRLCLPAGTGINQYLMTIYSHCYTHKFLSWIRIN